MDMTIDLLLEALGALKACSGHPDYKRMAIQHSITELINLKASLPSHMDDIWNGAIHVIHMTTAIDLQNAIAYDAFGRLAKSKDNHEVSFGEYYKIARNIYGLEAASTPFLLSGYEVINDLWHDNERNGCHIEDGTLE